MITIIFGAPGAGKTALMTYFLRETFKRDGKRLLESSQEKIREINLEHGSSLEMPKKPPIYSDFPVKIPDGYESFFQHYFINGYFFGVPNGSVPTINVAPGAKIFLSEGQRYFDSRQSKAFPSWVSAAFEMHRHYGLEIYIDVQRPKLIDLNIRELCRRFIEVKDIELERTETGRIQKTTFRCREFKSSALVEAYIATGDGIFEETSYTYAGDIFRLYDSFSHGEDFVPKGDGNYVYLDFLEEGKEAPLPVRQFYARGEPKEYRQKGGPKDNA